MSGRPIAICKPNDVRVRATQRNRHFSPKHKNFCDMQRASMLVALLLLIFVGRVAGHVSFRNGGLFPKLLCFTSTLAWCDLYELFSSANRGTEFEHRSSKGAVQKKSQGQCLTHISTDNRRGNLAQQFDALSIRKEPSRHPI